MATSGVVNVALAILFTKFSVVTAIVCDMNGSNKATD